jgi:hypothetical protein
MSTRMKNLKVAGGCMALAGGASPLLPLLRSCPDLSLPANTLPGAFAYTLYLLTVVLGANSCFGYWSV